MSDPIVHLHIECSECDKNLAQGVSPTSRVSTRVAELNALVVLGGGATFFDPPAGSGEWGRWVCLDCMKRIIEAQRREVQDDG